jgi:hypothetical protein
MELLYLSPLSLALRVVPPAIHLLSASSTLPLILVLPFSVAGLLTLAIIIWVAVELSSVLQFFVS